MEPARLDYLLERYHNQTCTEAELEELNAWFHETDQGAAAFEQRLQQAGGSEGLANELYSDFKSHTVAAGRPRFTIYYKVAAAAAILILVSVGGFYLLNHRNETTQQAVVVQPVIKQIEPGANKAILELGNGSKLVLDSAGNGQLAHEQGVAIRKTADGRLEYSTDGTSELSAAVVYNTIHIPRGGQYQLVLPDGSKVWLNAASSLRYPVQFTGNERKVQLTGEAYFEVAHNKEKPFRVVSNGQEVTVLGTHFNVKAYEDEESIQTTLLEGKVEVKSDSYTHTSDIRPQTSVILKPGEQAVASSNTSKAITVRKANTEEVMAWKSGYFLFDNQDVRSIMKMISRWYDVDIEYGALHKNERFGGTFSRSSQLKDILTNLEAIGNTRFTIKERRVIVSD